MIIKPRLLFHELQNPQVSETIVSCENCHNSGTPRLNSPARKTAITMKTWLTMAHLSEPHSTSLIFTLETLFLRPRVH